MFTEIVKEDVLKDSANNLYLIVATPVQLILPARLVVYSARVVATPTPAVGVATRHTSNTYLPAFPARRNPPSSRGGGGRRLRACAKTIECL